MTNRIAELRTQNNESQTDIAKLLGISRQAVSLYEKGDREPKLETWVKLANHFGVSVGYIAGVSNDKHDFYGGIENALDEP